MNPLEDVANNWQRMELTLLMNVLCYCKKTLELMVKGPSIFIAKNLRYIEGPTPKFDLHV